MSKLTKTFEIRFDGTTGNPDNMDFPGSHGTGRNYWYFSNPHEMWSERSRFYVDEWDAVVTLTRKAKPFVPGMYRAKSMNPNAPAIHYATLGHTGYTDLDAFLGQYERVTVTVVADD